VPAITTAPLPEARHLLALCRAGNGNRSALARFWCSDGDLAHWFSRAAWGLKAIVDGHGVVLGSRPPRLWLPDYFCNQSTWPLRQSPVEITFYPIDESLRPDWESCRRLATAAPPDLFLQVHYFGVAAELGDARAFCESHGAALIEDCAHVPAPAGAIGSAGDYVLYSLYKHFPIPDGGLLVIRRSADNAGQAVATTAEKVAKKVAEKAASTAAGGAPGWGIWAVKRLLQLCLPAAASRLGGAPTLSFEDDPGTVALPETTALSGAAARLLERLAGEMPRIAARRRENEAALRRIFHDVPGLDALFSGPGAGCIPYRAVFRADTPERAARYFGRMQNRGVAAETWPDLAPEVLAAPETHRAAIALRRTILAFPVHAHTSPARLAAAYGGVL
jgi:hypothetical protein